MRNLLLSAGLAAALLAATPAAAQMTTVSPIPAPPKPDLSAMKGFIGSWSCTQKSSRRPSAATSTLTYAPDGTGYWIVQKTKSPGVPWYPHESISTDYYTYDADAKHWVDIYVDNTGGYSVSTSPGPTGGTWVWHDLGLQKPQEDVASYSDFTNTLSGNTQTAVNSFKTKGGATVTVKGSCKRTG